METKAEQVPASCYEASDTSAGTKDYDSSSRGLAVQQERRGYEEELHAGATFFQGGYV
jgi:hypothetical protein